MGQFTGCISPSDKQVVDKFNEFLTMFPSEDLTFLYDKQGETSSVNGEVLDIGSNLSEGDLGKWCITSYINTKENDDAPISSFGVVLWFDRESRTAEGNLIFSEGEIDERYPIYYDEQGIHLVDEDVPKNIKEGFSEFKMMYEFIELDRKYLNSLESTRIMYNANVPLFKAQYKLDSKDKNIAKIKELYPKLYIDENNCALEFEGKSIPWDTLGGVSLKIVLDEKRNTYFTASMRFQRS